MQILFLIPELGYGGAESALLRLAGRLGQNHQVVIAVFRCSYQQGNYTHAPIPTSLPVVELDRSGEPLPSWMPASLARWWRRARELRRLKQECDVAISFLGGANLLNALMRAGKPCVLSERGSRRHHEDGNRLSRWIWCSLLDPLAYGRADRIVCVSEGLSNEIRQAVPRQQRHKVVTIAGYLDPVQALAARDAPIEPELLSLAKRPLLVAAGRLHPHKGFHHFLPLFAQVAASIPGSGLLLIGDGPQLQELISLADALGLTVSVSRDKEPINPSAQVIFLGYRPQPARYTKLGRAFVMPSLSEGLPNLLLEALAAGSWCLVADCPWGPAEILTHPDLGQLLPPIPLATSLEPWLEALKVPLLTSSPRHLSLACRQQLVDRFSIQGSAQRWELLMEGLVG